MTESVTKQRCCENSALHSCVFHVHATAIRHEHTNQLQSALLCSPLPPCEGATSSGMCVCPISAEQDAHDALCESLLKRIADPPSLNASFSNLISSLRDGSAERREEHGAGCFKSSLNFKTDRHCSVNST